MSDVGERVQNNGETPRHSASGLGVLVPTRSAHQHSYEKEVF